MEKTSHWAALYFVALMTFGNYVLFNLLVAILVEGFSAEVSYSTPCLTVQGCSMAMGVKNHPLWLSATAYLIYLHLPSIFGGHLISKNKYGENVFQIQKLIAETVLTRTAASSFRIFFRIGYIRSKARFIPAQTHQIHFHLMSLQSSF